MEPNPYQNDHDLLITLHEQVKGLRTDVKEMSTNTLTRVRELEKGKADGLAFDKLRVEYDNRIKWLERIAYGGIGILTFIEMYFRLFNTQ